MSDKLYFPGTNLQPKSKFLEWRNTRRRTIIMFLTDRWIGKLRTRGCLLAVFGSVGAAQASANDTSAVQVRTVREALSSYELIESLFFSDGACISPERGVYFDLDAGKIVLNSNPIEMPQLHAKVKYYSKSDAYATFEINTSIQGCFVKELVIPVTSSEIVTLSRYQIIIRGNYKSCKIDGFESASGGANHFKVIREKDQTLKISCIQGEGN